jgi:hypothetical protein
MTKSYTHVLLQWIEKITWYMAGASLVHGAHTTRRCVLGLVRLTCTCRMACKCGWRSVSRPLSATTPNARSAVPYIAQLSVLLEFSCLLACGLFRPEKRPVAMRDTAEEDESCGLSLSTRSMVSTHTVRWLQCSNSEYVCFVRVFVCASTCLYLLIRSAYSAALTQLWELPRNAKC